MFSTTKWQRPDKDLPTDPQQSPSGQLTPQAGKKDIRLLFQWVWDDMLYKLKYKTCNVQLKSEIIKTQIILMESRRRKSQYDDNGGV